MALHLRPATPADARAIAAIYAPHVLHGTATAEEVPPDAAEMAARMAKVRDAGLPYLIAELDGAVVAYAYLSAYHPRAAYRWTAEVSVYVADRAQRRGIGRALLDELIGQARALGLAQLIASISAQGGEGSIALHARAGFVERGRLPAIIFKGGHWLDCVYMQRALESRDMSLLNMTVS